MPLFYSTVLFSQAPPGDPAAAVIRDPRTAVAAGMLVAILLAGAVAIYLLDRWRKRQFADADAAQESAESLSTFREMYEHGELSEQEYQKVRSKMAAKIKKEVIAGQPSISKSVMRPTTANSEPNGPSNGANCDPGSDPAADPNTGSHES